LYYINRPGRESTLSGIEILLHSRLIEDALSAILTAAGFLITQDQDQNNYRIIVIIDFENFSDTEVVRLLQSRGVKIVVFASEADTRDIAADDIVPLSGILTDSLSADAFVRALRLIVTGERVFPRDLVLGKKPSVPPPGTKPQSGGVRLSPREREVLSHVVRGHSNKVIARLLGVTEATAKVHLKSVLRKINLNNRTQAAIWALANIPELDSTPLGGV
jgi:two-component system nitrate/nitrite response regulator NarL